MQAHRTGRIVLLPRKSLRNFGHKGDGPKAQWRVVRNFSMIPVHALRLSFGSTMTKSRFSFIVALGALLLSTTLGFIFSRSADVLEQPD